MKRHAMTNTHKRFIMSYLLFACVFLLTYIPVYNYIHGTVYDSVCKQSQSMLTGGVTSLETSANIVVNTYTATARDGRFRTLKYSSSISGTSPSDLSAMVNMLRFSFVSADLVEDAGIIRSASTAIMKDRSFYSDSFYSLYPDFINCHGYTCDEWLGVLTEGGIVGKWLPEMEYSNYENTYSALTYARVWFNNSSDGINMYFATLNADKLAYRLAEDEILQTGYLKIMDPDGAVILSRGQPEADDFEVISHRSAATGLTIELGLPTEYLNRQLEPLERMIMLYITLFTAIAIVMVLMFSYHSAAPMKKLMSVVDSVQLPQDGKASARRDIFEKLQSDYDAVALSITRLNGQLKSHAQIIDEQTEKLRDSLFERALQHALYSPKDRNDFQQMFPDFPQPFYIALMKCDFAERSVDDAVQERTAMLQAAHAMLDEIYYVHMLAGALLLVLTKSRPEAMERLRQKLAEDEDITIHILLTQEFDSPAELPAAFEQAQCMEMVSSTSDVVTFSDFSAAEIGRVSMPLSYSALLEMYEALTSGNETLARIILNDVTDVLLDHSDQIMLARHTNSIICHMLAHIKIEYPGALFSVIIPSFDAKNVEQLFREDLPNCFHHISVSLLEMRAPENDMSMQVLYFINDNLFSNNMCVTFVADRFGIAKATLQKIIKEATGVTFSAYVSTQRLERAYRLMHEPGVSVQQVSEMCGFSSTNSFYKAFRRKYGVAPSAVTGVPDPDEQPFEQ